MTGSPDKSSGAADEPSRSPGKEVESLTPAAAHIPQPQCLVPLTLSIGPHTARVRTVEALTLHFNCHAARPFVAGGQGNRLQAPESTCTKSTPRGCFNIMKAAVLCPGLLLSGAVTGHAVFQASESSDRNMRAQRSLDMLRMVSPRSSSDEAPQPMAKAASDNTGEEIPTVMGRIALNMEKTGWPLLTQTC